MRTLLLAAGCVVATSSIPLTALAKDGPAVAVRTCAVANADASISYASPPDVPMIARDMHATGTAMLRLDLTSSGAVANASIARSSGNGILDSAALNSVHWSSFRPATRDCAPVAGSYFYLVNFSE